MLLPVPTPVINVPIFAGRLVVRQDTKPHRSIPLALLLDALEYDLPPHRHNPASPAVSPPHHHPSHGTDEHDPAAGTHTFKIVTTKRTLLLCAPSEEEEIKWLSAVRALIARRSVVPGDSAATVSASVSGAVSGSLPASAASSPTGAVAARSGALAVPSTPTPAASLDAQAAQLSAHLHHPSASAGGSSAISGTLASSTTTTTTPLATAHPTAGAGAAGVVHRRRDSLARRLSLSGGGGFMGSLHANTAAATAQEA